MRPGRPPSYTPGEDAILMLTAGRSPEDTNAELTKAGFPSRSPGSIKNRRHYLQRSRDEAGTALDSYVRLIARVLPQDGVDELTSFVIRRRILDVKIEDLTEQLNALVAERESLNRQIHSRVQSEIDSEP